MLIKGTVRGFQQRTENAQSALSPQFLIRDNDRKFGSALASVAKASGIEFLRTPFRAARDNATCVRFMGGVRWEYPDHLLMMREAQLCRVIKEYVIFFNRARPHSGIDQRIPESREINGEGKCGGETI